MKRAFSILELILAIVIISIAVSAVPSIISSTSKNNSQILLQEAILSTKTILINEMSRSFNDVLDDGILKINSSNIDRKGLKYIHNKRDESDHNVTSLSKQHFTSNIDIQNAKKEKNILSLSSITDIGYIDQDINSDDESITVEFSKEFSSDPSDSKLIKVETKYNDQSIVLVGYSFNIGNPKAAKPQIENKNLSKP